MGFFLLCYLLGCVYKSWRGKSFKKNKKMFPAIEKAWLSHSNAKKPRIAYSVKRNCQWNDWSNVKERRINFLLQSLQTGPTGPGLSPPGTVCTIFVHT